MSARAPLAIVLFIAAFVVFLTGCATRPGPLPPVMVPFDQEHADTLLKPGPNTVKGSAFMRQNGGGVVTCAGFVVSLVPKTAYAEARFAALYPEGSGGVNPVGWGGREFAPTDYAPGYRTSTRTTNCDVQGFFTFENVADGSFYLVTSVVWQVPTQNQFMPNRQGGAIAQAVTVQGGKVVNVVMGR